MMDDKEFNYNCIMVETNLEYFKKLVDDEESLLLVDTMLQDLQKLIDRHR